MTTVRIGFRVFDGINEYTEERDFEALDGIQEDVDGCMESAVDSFCEEFPDSTYEEEWYVCEYDDDYADPASFDDLNDYAEYVELCDRLGEGYRMRYDDLGELSERDFDNSYNGCWDSFEEFCRNIFSEDYDIPKHLDCYIDWGLVARDMSMDYSTYEGRDGVHVFRD